MKHTSSRRGGDSICPPQISSGAVLEYQYVGRYFDFPDYVYEYDLPFQKPARIEATLVLDEDALGVGLAGESVSLPCSTWTTLDVCDEIYSSNATRNVNSIDLTFSEHYEITAWDITWWGPDGDQEASTSTHDSLYADLVFVRWHEEHGPSAPNSPAFEFFTEGACEWLLVSNVSQVPVPAPFALLGGALGLLFVRTAARKRSLI